LVVHVVCVNLSRSAVDHSLTRSNSRDNFEGVHDICPLLTGYIASVFAIIRVIGVSLETIIANLRRKILRMRRAYRWFFRGELLQGLDHR